MTRMTASSRQTSLCPAIAPPALKPGSRKHPHAQPSPRQETAPASAQGNARFHFANISVMAPVQRRASPGASARSPKVTPTEIHAAADLGTSGPSQPLPHRSAIQRSFGRHSLSDVLAHTDTAARTGARQMQAEAFTRGAHVAFADSPSLHLAAHEAAHVVQQRSGLHLQEGVGDKSDAHEQHAEAVAQQVTAGQSSETLLDRYASPAPAPPCRKRVQRFESEEHQHLGDVATGSRTYNLADPVKHPGDRFELTHGDILALSGDVFPAEELFRLAAIPGNDGKLVGTRDEVIWGLADPSIWEMRSGKTGPGPYTNKSDPRFAKGGIWENFSPSKDVVDAVTQRYLKLAAANANHFAAPLGRDKKGNPIATANSAGGNYRDLHEVAIQEAYKQGGVGGTIDMGMAREAAAQHFLTDSFAAGHLRTPISLIRTYWHDKYPLFWYNLRHKIALDTAIAMLKGRNFPNHLGYTEILESVEKLAPTLPAITLGDLLAKVFHDVDNAQGVAIKGGGKVMGDAHLDPATETLAVNAILAGNKDIEEAFNLGAQTKGALSNTDVIAKVRPLNGGTKDKYAAELKMPTPEKGLPPQNWQAPDIARLWDKPLLGNKGITVGAAIANTVQTGAIAAQLTGLADNFPADKHIPLVKDDLHPRAAYLAGFVAPLQLDPKAGVLDIIDWAPHDMWTGAAPRELVQDLIDKGAAGNTEENLGKMQMDQRVKILEQLIDAGKPGFIHSTGVAADLDVIFPLFSTLNHAGRLQLFKRVEGHDWTGAFLTDDGFLKRPDSLFKAMEKTGEDVKRLTRLLNGK